MMKKSSRKLPYESLSRALALGALSAGFALLAGCQSAPSASTAPTPPADLKLNQAAALRALGFEQLPDGDWLMSLSNSVLFEFDSDQLRTLQTSELMRIGRGLAALGVKQLRVEGHSDSSGDAAYNQKLSLRRAQSVARVLTAAGLAGPLKTQGLGSTRPIADNATEAGRMQNRRVALIVPSL